MSIRRRKVSVALASYVAVLLISTNLFSCPLCNRRETCFTSDIDRSDAAILGKTDSSGAFQTIVVLKAHESSDQESIRGMELPKGRNVIVFGRLKQASDSNASRIEWFHHYSVSRYGMDYLRRMAMSPSSAGQRLARFLPYLNSPELSVRDDAFYQIARTDFSELKQLEPFLERDFVIDLLSNPSSVVEVRSLALKMLALCGNRNDLMFFRELIVRPDAENLREINVAITHYLTLGKLEALKEIEERFILKTAVPHTMKLATIRALQFHLHKDTEIDKKDIKSSLWKFAKDPDVLDLIVPDLIQLKDWSLLNEVAHVFKTNKQRLVRVAAAEYLLACPEDEARSLLAELRSIDGDAVSQAETGQTVFSDVPPSKNDASFFTWMLASRFASPTVITTGMAAGIVVIVALALKRLRR